jgi:hypothetical protein
VKWNKARAPFRWLVFFSYYLAVFFLHLKFSLLLDRPLPGFGKHVKLVTFVEPLLLITLALLLLVIAYQFLQSTTGRLSTVLYWGMWSCSVALVDRFLLFKTIEYIHYPQYALLAVLLIWCIDPDRAKICVGRVLFWTTVLGVFDELHQYVHLAKNYGDYLDFNDFFLNLQGAAAGVLLVYGFAGNRAEHGAEVLPSRTFLDVGWPRQALKGVGGSIELCFAAAALAFVIVLGASGRLQLSPEKIVPAGGLEYQDGKMVFYVERKPGMMGRWNGGVRTPLYYVLSPAEGSLLLLGVGLLFTSFGLSRKYSGRYCRRDR